jgi:hypothetical protein
MCDHSRFSFHSFSYNGVTKNFAPYERRCIYARCLKCSQPLRTAQVMIGEWPALIMQEKKAGVWLDITEQHNSVEIQTCGGMLHGKHTFEGAEKVVKTELDEFAKLAFSSELTEFHSMEWIPPSQRRPLVEIDKTIIHRKNLV